MSDLEVPWAIHHSEHSARLARVQAQQLLGTGSGVSRPGDLKVLPLEVPGNGFRVMPGGGTAQSRDTDASARESYGPLLGSELTVTDVPGTGSGETRRDLVILEITDPAMQSVTYPAPTDPEYTGGWLDGDNFNRITVIPNVGASVTSLDQITTGAYAHVTGITLAAINWPESTSTIGPGAAPAPGLASIEDLRELQAPRMSPFTINYALYGDEVNVISATSAYPEGQTWPVQAETAGEIELDIPAWATHMECEGTFYGVLYPGGDAWGSVWLQLAPTANPANVKSQDTRWDTDGATNASRATLGLADTIRIPAALRGTRQKFYPRATRYGGTAAASARMDRVSSLAIKGWFVERVV